MPLQKRQAPAPAPQGSRRPRNTVVPQPQPCPGTPSSARGGTRDTPCFTSVMRRSAGTTKTTTTTTTTEASPHITRMRTMSRMRCEMSHQGGGGGWGGRSVVGVLALCLYLCVWQVGPALGCGHNPLRRFQPLSRMLRQDMSTLMGVLRDTNPELYTQVEGEWRIYADCVRQVDTGYFKRSSSSSFSSSSSSSSSAAIATLDRIHRVEGAEGGEGEGVIVKVEKGQDGGQTTLVGEILGKLQLQSRPSKEGKRRGMVEGRGATLFHLLTRALLENPDDESTNHLGNLDFLKTSALLR